MSSASIISIIVIIVAVILVDVFCGDVTNVRRTNPRQNNQTSEQKSPEIVLDGKSTTPRPTLGRRVTQNPITNRNNPSLSRTSTPPPKKWIQQNSIWIRNEQAASGGNADPQNANSNPQAVRGTTVGNANLGPTRSSGAGGIQGSRQNLGGSSINNAPTHQNSRQQALINGLEGNRQTGGIRQNLDSQLQDVGPTGGKIHQTNRQQALLDGLEGNQRNLGPVNPSSPQNANNKPLGPSSTRGTPPKLNINPTPPTSKPMTYAGAVGPKSPTPGSPTAPKTPSISPPQSPQPGGPKKDVIPSTGPTGNNENLDNTDIDENVTEGDATDAELREFSEMLLRKDTNNAMKYVTLNLQGMTTSRSPNDEAPQPLLTISSEAYNIPSIEKIMLLYNNYFLESSQNEVYTGQERIEENNLLDTVLATPVMQYARSFLIKKGKIGKDPKEFRDLLRQIWFNMYSRGQGRIGSSGFEHVFLAEIKNSQVSGLHNWLYFNEEEKLNRANYLGYLKKLDLGEKGAILKYHFTFHDIDKPVGSMFIGTSPELELALYSTCFVLRADKICPLKMNGNKFIIRTYTYRYRGKNMIGSAFPEI